MKFILGDNLKIDSLEGVPGDLKPLYVEQADGGFALGDDAATKATVKVIDGLGRSLRASREEADEAKRKAVDLSSLSEYGEGPEEIAAAITQKMEDLQKKVKTKGDNEGTLEKLRQDLKAAHGLELTKKDEDITSLTAQLSEVLVDQKIKSAIGDSAVNLDIATRVISDFIDTDRDEKGNFVVQVVDKDRDPRKNPATGEFLAIGDLVGEMKKSETYGSLFKSEKPSGSGHESGAASAARQAAGNAPDASPVSKISAGLAAR